MTSPDAYTSVEIDVGDLAQRLVIGRKRDGRGIYDPGAKRELLELCRRPGASVARLARECGVNANLVASWLPMRSGHQLTSLMRAMEPVLNFVCEA